MSEIQVSTIDLRDGSQTLNGASNEIGDEQGKLSSIPGSVGDAYDGQLRQALEGIVAGSDQTAARLQNRSFDLGDELFSRATGFEAANEAGRSAVLGASTEYINFIQTTPILGHLSFLSKLKGLPSLIWHMGGFPIGGLLTWIFFSKKPTITEPKIVQISAKQPVKPIAVKNISQDYSSNHQAIDIASPKGAPIQASLDGKVVSVKEVNAGTYNRAKISDDEWKNIDITHDSSKNYGYGNSVILEYKYEKQSLETQNILTEKYGLKKGESIYALYAHLDKIKVKDGQEINIQDQIGNVGNDGWVYSQKGDGSHLHLEFKMGKSDINVPWSKLPNNHIDPNLLLNY